MKQYCAYHIFTNFFILLPADINKKGGLDDVTPLHLACKYNSVDCVKVLVGVGAEVNVKDAKGKTPLHIACRKGLETAALVAFYVYFYSRIQTLPFAHQFDHAWLM